MATTGNGRSHSALNAALDIFRVRQYFNGIGGVIHGLARLGHRLGELAVVQLVVEAVAAQ